MNICDHRKCTGCALCSSICAKQCISMVENEEGFMYPSIDENKCVSCGICQKFCPVNSLVDKNDPVNSAISAWSTNDIERFSSSSGGVFPEIANQIIERQGVVYGAAFDVSCNLRHIRVENKEGLKVLKGSKYFQSDIKDCYSAIKKDLLEGKEVLFSGTGCQIAAIKRYLSNIDTLRLLSVEILCHGVPSKRIIDSYIHSINPTSKPTKINFRDKSRFGWEYSCVFEVEFEDGATYYGRSSTDLFYLGFLNELFLRESCYECPYVGNSRVGDITLADYWRVSQIDIPELVSDDMEKGVSLILVNSKKGDEVIASLSGKNKIVCHGANLDKASEHNQALKGNYKRPLAREQFFKYNEKYGYNKAIFRIFPRTIIGIKFRKSVKKVIGERIYSKLKSMLMKG